MLILSRVRISDLAKSSGAPFAEGLRRIQISLTFTLLRSTLWTSGQEPRQQILQIVSLVFRFRVPRTLLKE